MDKPEADFDWEALDNHLAEVLRERSKASRPSGTFTVEEFMRRHKLKTRGAAHGRIAYLVRIGVVERAGETRVPMRGGDGRVRVLRRTYYRIRRGGRK